MEYGPYSSWMRLISAAMSSVASSHEMRTYLLVPRVSGCRSPCGSQSTRFMGWVMRFFEYVRRLYTSGKDGVHDFIPGSNVVPLRPVSVQ